MKWRKWRDKRYWFDSSMSDMEIGKELMEYMRYFCAVGGMRETAVAGKSVAVILR